MSKHMNNGISRRKLDHLFISLSEDVSFNRISAGFEDVVIPHDSLPEVDFEEIDISTQFVRKTISAPLMIDAITGGFDAAEKINRKLAEAAEKQGIAFALGSQRAMIENPECAYTYKVRGIAPTIPIIGNIGIANLTRETIKKLDSIIKELDMDAIEIHLNPLQEALQPEGDKNFKGKIELIDEVCDSIDVPVIIKEVGHGISEETLKKIQKTRVEYINVAGAGGTSWTKIESIRQEKAKEKRRKGKRNHVFMSEEFITHEFDEDGIPTVISLINAKRLTDKKLISSGGIRSGVHIAKSICLGAEICAAAAPFLHAYKNNTVEQTIEKWKRELKIFMFTRACVKLKDLRKLKPKIIGKTKEYL